MRRKYAFILTPLAVALLGVVVAVAGAEKPQDTEEDTATAAKKQETTLPEPAPEGGHLERGGKDIGRGFGHGGGELGRGTAGFGKNVVQGKFGQAGSSIGRGAAEFGKGVGGGTARGFKSIGRAFRNLGKKIDRAVSDDE